MSKFLFVLITLMMISEVSASDNFASGAYVHGVMLSKGSLYISGNNFYGELIQPNTTKEYRTFVKFADKIERVAAAYNRTAFVTKNNKLYYFGWRSNTTDTVAPTFIANNVSDVSLTSTSIYYISSKKLFEFSPKFNTTKELVVNDEPVSLATGTSHLVIFTKSGSIWTYGSNSQGQLCTGDILSKTSPVNVGVNGMYSSIAANGNNSYLILKSGELSACGDNSSGQFGLGKTNPMSINIPTTIPNATNVKKVAPTSTGVYILRQDGLVDLIGWHNYIAPNSKPYNHSLTVYTLPVLSQITDIGSGLDTIYLKDQNGTLYAWGGNLSGKLGDGTLIERHSPVVITLPENEKSKHCTKDLPCNDDKDCEPPRPKGRSFLLQRQ